MPDQDTCQIEMCQQVSEEDQQRATGWKKLGLRYFTNHFEIFFLGEWKYFQHVC